MMPIGTSMSSVVVAMRGGSSWVMRGRSMRCLISVWHGVEGRVMKRRRHMMSIGCMGYCVVFIGQVMR